MLAQALAGVKSPAVRGAFQSGSDSEDTLPGSRSVPVGRSHRLAPVWGKGITLVVRVQEIRHGWTSLKAHYNITPWRSWQQVAATKKPKAQAPFYGATFGGYSESSLLSTAALSSTALFSLMPQELLLSRAYPPSSTPNVQGHCGLPT